MKIKIITASAGSGKTYKLTSILDEEIAAKRAEPERVVAVTFTKQAAAELIERARRRLLEKGRGIQAHRLLAARIGTVNSVCGTIVTDFAFELGLSPALKVLDEGAAELEFSRALARVVTAEDAEAFEDYKHRFASELDWRYEVRRVVEAARANNLDAPALRACAERSKRDLDAVLGPVTTRDLDGDIAAAIETTVAKLEKAKCETDKTADYIILCRDVLRGVQRGSGRWGDWAKLASKEPAKKLLALVDGVGDIAAEHRAHPRLREDMHDMIDRVFKAASDALDLYQEHKRALGMIDFIDQEALALKLLKMPEVRDALRGEIDLFLVDEFQDTSPIQLAVFLELAAIANESIWVGDPKQAIYAFRGTDPALMDAAIESLTSLTADGDLTAAATSAMSRGAAVETLDTSYRSRPGLVHLTSEIFAPAFETQGIAPERTKLEPKLVVEPEGLGEIVQAWPLTVKNEADRANAAAAGVVRLLASGSRVRGRDGSPRVAVPEDVAILCRTNAQCAAVAAALGTFGLTAIVPRVGLTSTHEAMVVLAGLALWLDPRDRLAAGELARIISFPEDLDGFVAQALAPRESGSAFASEPAVERVLAAREAECDLGPLAAFDAVLAATDVRRLCAEWGDTPQRLANLDALRGHAVDYVQRARSAGDAVTLVGMLGYIHELADSSGYKKQRQDSQAMLTSESEAVTVSTWHAAKGLEWPITVLYGLETIRDASSWGVHVLSDREGFDLEDPLGGRWIRYWPFPYTRTNQLGPVREAVESSPGHDVLVKRAAREALRVLYVGWTRARDRLILAASPKKFLTGILGTLERIDTSLIHEPVSSGADCEVVPQIWAGVNVDVVVAPSGVREPEERARIPGQVTVGNPVVARAPARLLPSELDAVPGQVVQVIDIGPRIPVTNAPNMEHVGHAVHGFLAADRPGLDPSERLAMADELLTAFGVQNSLSATDVVAAAERFWTWCEATYPGARQHREWPVAQRLPEGTIVAGIADLVLTNDAGFALIDHKTFPGADDKTEAKALSFAGQLHAYASGIAAATSATHLSSWIHFPVLGKVVEVQLTTPVNR